MTYTEIYFYSGASNKLHTACRLCAKAVQQGLNVLVYSLDRPLLTQFDKLLWTISPTSFIGHCHAENTQLVKVSPVVLSQTLDCGNNTEVLLNLHGECPPTFDQFKRLIEITDTSNEDKMAGRKRYRMYQQAGYKIYHHQLDDA